MATTAPAAGESVRDRLLDATSVVLAQHGPRKLSLSDIANVAGVSRPTLYRHFSSKDDLLQALATHEKQRYATELANAINSVDHDAQLDRALRFVVEFQKDYPMRGLVVIEPAFMIDQFERSLRTMSTALMPLLEEHSPAVLSGQIGSADLADLVVRTALSHFLLRGDDEQLLRELRHCAGLGI
jgi:TetR/AcrR family transcriptional regulator, repressor for uid operon